MPAFAEKGLTTEQAKALVAYMETVEERRRQERAKSPRIQRETESVLFRTSN
jgi:mono/diheme cytochrome c family protein